MPREDSRTRLQHGGHPFYSTEARSRTRAEVFPLYNDNQQGGLQTRDAGPHGQQVQVSADWDESAQLSRKPALREAYHTGVPSRSPAQYHDSYVEPQRPTDVERRPIQSGKQNGETSSGGSMFNSASNVGIHGGQFTTTQWNAPQTVHINYNFQQDHSKTLDKRMFNTQHASNFMHSTIDQGEIGKDRFIPPLLVNPPSGRSSTLYENHLSTKGRGHPLWIPEVDLGLPDVYREKGVSIGDVGILTPDGAFDFLFSICQPADSPVNEGELPANFAPLSPPLDRRDVREFREFQRGRYLGSFVRVRGDGDMFKSGLKFEPTSPDGAILALPEGAYLQELNNVARVRRHIATHAVDWYKFANGPRGREVKNGDLRIVIGCDKTTAWGMGTFSGVSAPADLQLQFSARGDITSKNASEAYEWMYHGVADVKVGPEEAPPSRPRNQCLFVRTLSVTLSQRCWDEILLPTLNTHVPHYPSATGMNPYSQGGWYCPDWRTYWSWQDSILFQKLAAPKKVCIRMSALNASLAYDNRNWEPKADVPNVGDMSRWLRSYLWEMYPHASMVITSDRDWQSALMTLLRKGPSTSASQFMDAVRKLNDVRLDESTGAAYYEPKHFHNTDADHIVEAIQTGQETAESLFFGSTEPTLPDARSEYIDRLVDSLVETTGQATLTSQITQFSDGHRAWGTSLEFDILPRLTNTEIREAVEALRDGLHDQAASASASSSTTETIPNEARAVRRLGHALYARYLAQSQQDDLDEAIWWFWEAAALTPRDDYTYLEVVLGLCRSLIARFQLLGLEEDRESLIAALRLEREIDCAGVVSTVKDLIDSVLHRPDDLSAE